MRAANDEALPPETPAGEWIEDTLDDGSLWFASSDNLAFEAIARELVDYPQGRRWVSVVDGRPAWVVYYVPGEILGFEVDTHHFGAAATEFRFAAGATWDALAEIPADYEEIVAFDAKWLRLYRAADQLPPGTRFLRIEFPDDAELDAARLTEVWLRCLFDQDPGIAATNPTPVVVPDTATAPAVSAPVSNETLIEPLVVTTFVYRPLPSAEPVFPPLTVDSSWTPVQFVSLPHFGPYDLLGDVVPLVDTPPPIVPPPPKSVFSRIADLFRHRGIR